MEWINKIVVITGATPGIGKATKEILRNKGCIVYNLDIAKPAEEDIYYIHCDVSKKEKVNSAIDKIYGKEKRNDFLFANAGVHL